MLPAYLNPAPRLLSLNSAAKMVIAQRGDIDLHAAVAGKGHRPGHQQTAVGTTLVPGQYLRAATAPAASQSFQLRDVARARPRGHRQS